MSARSSSLLSVLEKISTALAAPKAPASFAG
jgi:hypothetical protein